MFEINCDNCGADLVVDVMLTRDTFAKDMNYLVDDAGDIIESTIQQYLVYKCQDCGAIYTYTYKDWERLARIRIAADVIEIKKRDMFRNIINTHTIKSTEKVYCGKCSGYFGDGNCLKDIIDQCVIRTK